LSSESDGKEDGANGSERAPWRAASFYRREVIDARQSRLQGDVFLLQPVSIGVIGAILAAIVVLFVALLMFGEYARVERVQGYLKPTNGLVKIEAGRFGTLSTLYVDEGQAVDAGQRLARIDLTQQAGGTGSPLERSEQALDSQLASAESQIGLERQQLASEGSKLRSDQAQLRTSIAALESQLQIQRKLIESSEEVYERLKLAAERGYVTVIAREQRYQELLAGRSEEQRLTQELARQRAELARNRVRMAQLPGEAEARIARLRSEQSAIDERSANLDERRQDVIVSPTKGRVVAITGASLGGSVTPGRSFLTILPQNSTMVAELFVPSSAAGFVEPGQEVRILYDAFPYQRFGSFEGVVANVGGSILSPGEVTAPFEIKQPVYRVVVRLVDQSIRIRGQAIAVQPGMTLSANIVLERRSFLDWFLAPLRAVRARS